MDKPCRLCEALCPGVDSGGENTIIMDFDNFVVMPTLGQFIEGWVMVVSKKHVRCSREHTSEELQELTDIVSTVQQCVEKHYGPTVIFEHGPSRNPSRHSGCCVEHTHIHVAPCSARKQFCDKIIFSKVARCGLLELPVIVPDPSEGYLLVCAAGGGHPFDVYSVNCPVPRQYLRQVLAAVTGNEPRWDWHEHSCRDNIKRTLALVRVGAASSANITTIPGLEL